MSLGVVDGAQCILGARPRLLGRFGPAAELIDPPLLKLVSPQLVLHVPVALIGLRLGGGQPLFRLPQVGAHPCEVGVALLELLEELLELRALVLVGGPQARDAPFEILCARLGRDDRRVPLLELLERSGQAAAPLLAETSDDVGGVAEKVLLDAASQECHWRAPAPQPGTPTIAAHGPCGNTPDEGIIARMKRVNLFTADTELDADDPDGFKAGMLRFGPSLDAAAIGGTIYDLPPGQSNCPYHYEYGCEEWVIVVAGRLTLRHPDGEDVSSRATSPSSRKARPARTG